MDEQPTIVVAPFNPAWADCFRLVHAHVWPAVSDVALRIDHVGSTAVPDLAAKPIIDMDVVVATDDLIGHAVDRLATIDYAWIGNLGVDGREAFRPPTTVSLPAHHLYLVVENNRAHLDHWLLRDLLKNDAEARSRYTREKRENAVIAAGDVKVYTARKAALVAEMLTAARAARGLPPVEYWVPTPAELLPSMG